MKDTLLIINSVSENPTRDELDVLVQAEAVEKVLDELGISSRRVYLGLDLGPVAQLLKENPPLQVFNLVETLGGMGALIHVCTALLEAFRIPFTGSGTYALLTTTDKVRTKTMLERHGLPTPKLIKPISSKLPEKNKK
jgi:D-alanine-D-alanine ligase